MKLLSWNCQGLGRALTVKNLRDLVSKFRPSILFLMETKMCSGKLKRIKRKCGFEQEITVDPRGLTGGLSVWWHDSITITVMYQSKNIIHVIAEANGLSVPNFISFVYGLPKEGARRGVWNTMRGLAAGVRGSWLVVGDFNDLLSQSEKEGVTQDRCARLSIFKPLYLTVTCWI
ncbi:hypothetical protein QN277_017771 [Acacia crassicarpa]|uniref:Endonuclease/exonuclease/phosphatase domain-containing protein n=1 Tax=Acacia crassicarpa TaxID=499986 RepID=A0AAE1JP90_9FABA|nr:hypothetical protein QN277_017771 [Acacia crassicarpa]